VNALEISAAGIFRHSHNVNGIAGTIDDGRRSDANFRGDLAAAAIVAGGFAAAERGSLPEKSGSRAVNGIRVKGVDRIAAQARNIKNILLLPANSDLRKIQRLRIHVAINAEFTLFPELRGIHIRGSQRRFIEVLTGRGRCRNGR